MSRLIGEDRVQLLALAESLVPKDQIHALGAYGSRVAGVESEGSDFDLIIVTKDFKQDIPERAAQASTRSPPIIVDKETLLGEAGRPMPGEYVIGRFLDIYEPLVNAEFLHKVEIEYKKWIIAEELKEIQSDYNDFSANLILPYKYFLFDKLHKRAFEYPETIGSSANTYKGVQKSENLEFTLRGFREAAELLASRGIIEKNDDSIRIIRGRKERKRALSLLYKMYPLTTRGAVKYAFHSFASGLGVEFKTRPFPKLKVIEKVESTIELDRPRKLLRLEEGVVFDDASKMVEEVALLYGFGPSYEFEEEKKGSAINSSKELEIREDGRLARFVLKRFSELKAGKWVLLNLWSLAAKKFNMSPLSRLNREVEAVRRLHELGIKTHRITGVVLDERTLVSEYSEGIPLDKSIMEITSGRSTDTSDIKRYAQVLGKLHKAGLVYGDTKPANALVGKDGIELLDLEQAVDGGDKAWDLAEFLYYSAKIAKQAEGMKLVAESFLAAYLAENGSKVIAKARSLRYLTPFMLFITPKKRRVVRGALERYSASDDVGH